MKHLMAKIKKTSLHYKKGLSPQGKSLWLEITGFTTRGEKNYRIRAIKGAKKGFVEHTEIWVSPHEITLKHREDGQLSLLMYSPQEKIENKNNPKYYNQRRFEVISQTEKQFFYAPDIETMRRIVAANGLGDAKIKQVKRLTRKDINNDV